jgi:daunorubicin resistance ABC transporter ATP-binding subunit
MNKAFELTNISKYYGSVHALESVSLSSDEGKVFGLLGPNGAGKSTIVKVLATLQSPTNGTASILGVDIAKEPHKVRKLIGLAGQFAAVDNFQTGYENIVMVGELYGLSKSVAQKRARDLLDRLSLSDSAGRQVGTYSGGMRRRLDLGSSLVGEPRVLFLDEPTTGLDPKTRLDLWDVIRNLVKNGTSILLTTQYLEEADALADHIAVIDKGGVIAEGTAQQLKDNMGGDWIQIKPIKNVQDVKQIIQSKSDYIVDILDDNKTLRLQVKNSSVDIMHIVSILNSAKIEVDSITAHQPSLDDVFLKLTGTKERK